MADDDGDNFFFLRGGWPPQEVPVDAPKLVSLSILRNFTKQLNKIGSEVFAGSSKLMHQNYQALNISPVRISIFIQNVHFVQRIHNDNHNFTTM